MSTEQRYAGTRRPPRRVPVRRTRTKNGVVTLRRNSTKNDTGPFILSGSVPTDGHFCVGGKIRDYSWAGPTEVAGPKNRGRSKMVGQSGSTARNFYTVSKLGIGLSNWAAKAGVLLVVNICVV